MEAANITNMENQEEILKFLAANAIKTQATLKVLSGIVAQLYAKDKQDEKGIKKSHEVYFLEIQEMIRRVESTIPRPSFLDNDQFLQ